jgi:hypothetical protein
MIPRWVAAAEDDVSAPVEQSAGAPATPSASGTPHTGSLSRRMLVIAAGWILVLLLAGGFALDRTLSSLVQRNFDDQLAYMLTAMIASAEIEQDGEVVFYRALGDQRFLEPNSGLYWQISGAGHDPWPSRSLWDRTITKHTFTTAISLPMNRCGWWSGP